MTDRELRVLFEGIYWVLIPVIVLGLVSFAMGDTKEFFGGPTITMSTFLVSGLALSISFDLPPRYRLFYFINMTVFILSLLLSVLIVTEVVDLVSSVNNFSILSNLILLSISIASLIITKRCSH